MSTQTSAAVSTPPRPHLGVNAVTPYLFFHGRCAEALAFYQEVLGAEITAVFRFKDNPDTSGRTMPPEMMENIMHASLKIGTAEVFMSDGCGDPAVPFQSFGLSLTVATAADATHAFAALSKGGEVRMPLGKTFFSPCFGIAADRFGVCWMIYVLPANDS